MILLWFLIVGGISEPEADGAELQGAFEETGAAAYGEDCGGLLFRALWYAGAGKVV